MRYKNLLAPNSTTDNVKLDYFAKCNIPGCDQEPYSFSESWIPNAIPGTNGIQEKCTQFEQVFVPEHPDLCNNTGMFDHSNKVTCTDFIYDTNELTLQNEFNLTCDNEWKLTLIGTINNAGLFFFMATMGILSDKFGRRTVYIYSLFAGAIAGTIKSFSVNYVMYAVFEFIDSSLVSGTYAIGFVLAMEMLGPSKRVIGGILIACSYTIGEVLVGFIAMYALNFRLLVRIVYCPMILVLIYFWLIPESVRWLWVNGKSKAVIDVVLKAADANKITLKDDTLQLIYSCGIEPRTSLEEQSARTAKTSDKRKEMKKVFRSRILLLRIAKCFLVWMTCAFVYYGLSLNAVSLAGNKFLNFMLVCAAEIPGYFITNLLSGRIGRKWTLSLSLFVCGLSCLGTQFIPMGESTLGKLSFFFVGKAAITVAFTVLYVFTSEMFPTSLRNSLVLICSTVGRIGSMSAPQTPLLAKYVPALPLLLFGGLAILSGFTVLLFPETLNTSLPDTIEEAENIGKKKK
ncbi:hypothetical protein HA402_013578 [Bradysia odoriphaga]|nr:hypothetical protein HA402_013578 [Bradysia odoriphaga]